MPGVPASLTSTTRSPAPSRSRITGIDSNSVWSSRRRSSSTRTPICLRSEPVRRVSSQQTRSAASRASTARGARSPRLPIGVDTRVRTPVIRVSPVACRARGPTGGTHRFGLDDGGRPWRPRTEPPRRHRGGRQHDEVTVEMGDVDGKAHLHGVYRPGRTEQQCAVDAVAAEQAHSPVAPRFGDLQRGEHSALVHQPRHGRSVIRTDGARSSETADADGGAASLRPTGAQASTSSPSASRAFRASRFSARRWPILPMRLICVTSASRACSASGLRPSSDSIFQSRRTTGWRILS